MLVSSARTWPRSCVIANVVLRKTSQAVETMESKAISMDAVSNFARRLLRSGILRATRATGQLVPEAEHGQQELRSARRGLDLLAEVLDVDVDRAFVGDPVVTLRALKQLPPREDPARSGSHRLENPEFPRRAGHKPVVTPDLMLVRVQDERAET